MLIQQIANKKCCVTKIIILILESTITKLYEYHVDASGRFCSHSVVTLQRYNLEGASLITSRQSLYANEKRVLAFYVNQIIIVFAHGKLEVC